MLTTNKKHLSWEKAKEWLLKPNIAENKQINEWLLKTKINVTKSGQKEQANTTEFVKFFNWKLNTKDFLQLAVTVTRITLYVKYVIKNNL